MTAAASPNQKMLPLNFMLTNFGAAEFAMPISKMEFISLAEKFPNLQMEREADGTLSIMSPVKKGTGRREFNLSGYFFMWHFQTKMGEFYSPSTGFDLPNGATKSPDVAWISPEKLAGQSAEDDEKFVNIVPDFVAEVRSSSDNLKKLKAKMTNSWMANGVRLAWLIDPYQETAYIYRAGENEPEIVVGFSGKSLSGENILVGFELPLQVMKK